MKHQAKALSREELRQLDIAQILPNADQPRKRFKRNSLEALARSLAQQGVIQPLLVRPHPLYPQRYELVAGERRLRAMRLLGWQQAPALVREIPQEQLLESALVENIQREALTPIEEAQAYRLLLLHFRYTQEELARRVGKDRSTIANLIRLLALPPQLQEDVEAERLSVGHARAVLTLDAPETQLELGRWIVAQGLSVRETEALVRRAQQGKRRRSRRQNTVDSDAALSAVVDTLETRLGTRVRIAPGAEGAGKIEIEYYSLEDFNRIYELLLALA